MPPSRRKPAATPPVRKPRVAGLRRPAAAPEPEATEVSEVSEVSGVESTQVMEPVKPKPSPRPSPAPRPSPKPGYEPPAYAAPAVTEPEAEEPEVAEEPEAVESPEVAEVPEVVEAPEVAELPELSEVTPKPKPSPRAKTRDEGTPKPSSLDEAEAAEVAEEPAPAKPGPSKELMLSVALIVVGVLLAGAAVLFRIQDSEISSATGNTALLDVARTAQVKDQVSKAAEALFSYDFNNIAKTENAAKDLLVTDGVRDKYTKLMGEVKRLAPQQKMVVTCTVTRSAVIMLNGDLAKVMVFIDQSSTRTDTKATTAGSAQLHLNAQLQGDKWKITDMDTYVAPQAQTPPAASPSASPPPSK
ncbi:hypothetical protein AB5J62_02155 [Amycolatopsis sp. cg5]|uniref:hypothetical protein n=1 Tax=Amycolatopsis sp. cg5 TaxID=3238802 RepID=UPI0035262FF7